MRFVTTALAYVSVQVKAERERVEVKETA